MKLLALALTLVLFSSAAFAKDGLTIPIYTCLLPTPFNAETGTPYPKNVSKVHLIHDACANRAFLNSTITEIGFNPYDNTKLELARVVPFGSPRHHYSNGFQIAFMSYEQAKQYKDLLESGRVSMLIVDPQLENFALTVDAITVSSNFVIVFKSPAQLKAEAQAKMFDSPSYAYFKR